MAGAAGLCENAGICINGMQVNAYVLQDYAKMFESQIGIRDFGLAGSNTPYVGFAQITNEIEVYALLTEKKAFDMGLIQPEIIQENMILKERIRELESVGRCDNPAQPEKGE